MPGGDRTGPMGMGMRTGRRAGYCRGEDRPGCATAGYGWRSGGGRGRGCGYRGPGRGFAAGWGRPWGFSGPQGMSVGIDTGSYGRSDPDTEKRILTRQAEDLQVQLDAVRRRLDAIDTAPPAS
jgi:hypothetical protein